MPSEDAIGFDFFDEVVEGINRALAAVNGISKYIWESNCTKCKLREEPEDADHWDVVRCRHPEHINYVNVDNCKYERCPLIKPAR